VGGTVIEVRVQDPLVENLELKNYKKKPTLTEISFLTELTAF